MQDYSIAKSPIPIVNQVLMTILAGEFVFVLSIFLITFIRNTLQIDATLAILFWVIFLIKTFLVLLYVGKLLINWLRKSYVVYNNHLVIVSNGGGNSTAQSSPNLKFVRGAQVEQSRMARRFDFGDIEIKFEQSVQPEPMIIRDVLRPREVAAQLASIKR